MGIHGAVGLRRMRVAGALAVIPLCWAAVGASRASAASMTTDCAGLQAALNQAQNGDVVTLNQMCTATNSGASAGSFTLASGSTQPSFTLQGQSGSGAGFDGTGVASSLLSATGAGSPTTFTIEDLTFQNASQANSGPALNVSNGPYGLTLNGDTFTNNRATGGGTQGGAVYINTSATSGSVTVSNSSFDGNVATGTGGAITFDDGSFNGSGPQVVLTNNKFTSNSVQAGGSLSQIEGGAVTVMTFLDNALEQLTQSGNTFSGNSVSGGGSDAYGGAESTTGMQVSSTGDVFTGNSIQAPAGSHLSEGSALSISNSTCNSLVPSHVATNVVIAGNSIADGASTPANAWGALYLGCGRGGSNKLTLINSTISGNKGGGGTAGIWGGPSDQLTLENSILNGNSDGADLTGFSGTGGSVTASYSDLCNGSSAYGGSGNICANPNLANASGGDAHETYSSPTIDAGSNSLVPNGMSTDVYGQPRIEPKLAGGNAIVDIGAAEYTTIQHPAVTITTPAEGATYNEGQVVNSSFTCTEAPGGPGISSCTDPGEPSGAAIDTSTPGSHTFTVIAQSADGLSTTATVQYTVAGRPTVKITVPTHRTYYLHQHVHSNFRCSEGTGGPGIASCTNQFGARSGALIDTSKVGVHYYRVTARSRDGQLTTVTVSYTVRRPPAHQARKGVRRKRPLPSFTG